MRKHPFGGAVALLPLFLFCLVTPSKAKAQECEHERPLNATGGLNRLERVRVIAGAGSLEVTGRSDLAEVRVRARACASDPELLAALSIRVRGDDNTLIVEAIYPEDRLRLRNHYARIDLEVDVPMGVPADIEDGSGEATVQGTGTTRVDDGSGNLILRDIRGALTIEDGSGSIDIRTVAGAVDIEDGSGEIEVRDVRGAVEVDDGSGNVTVRGVGGSVHLSDGSGELRIADVTSNVVVDDDGSGSIHVERIGGNFTVDDDGSGDVSYTNVSGRVSVPDDD